MRHFDAMRSKSCPASLTAHETQNKTCNQRKNAIDWANRSLWVHNNILQFLPYQMMYFKTTLLSGQQESGQQESGKSGALPCGSWTFANVTSKRAKLIQTTGKMLRVTVPAGDGQ